MVFKQKYPLSNAPETKAWLTIGFGFFVALFLMVFQPFQLSAPGLEYRYLKISGYGLITSFILFVYHYLLMPRLDERQWTIGKEIITVLLLILAIAVLNFLYTQYVFDWDSAFGHGLLSFIFYTLAVGVFPVTILTFLKQHQLNRKYLAAAQAINTNIHHEAALKTSNRTIILEGDYNDRFSLDPSTLLFIESIGNYVHIHFLDNGRKKRKELRSTLKNMQDQLMDVENLFKSHRAFLVNLHYVRQVTGNAQGLRLELIQDIKDIPVSRSKVKEFRQLALCISSP